jgi:hypothetical protein
MQLKGYLIVWKFQTRTTKTKLYPIPFRIKGGRKKPIDLFLVDGGECHKRVTLGNF